MADLAYTTAGDIDSLAGTLAVDLRTDDGVEATLVADAIDCASADVDFYTQGRYAAADLAENRWARHAATAFALEVLCIRRLNDVPTSLAEMCERYRKMLQLVLEGKAQIPGAARSRRPGTVTNYVPDLRRLNNQMRRDQNRSTGARAASYRVMNDPSSPDMR
jgi:hypothetical protein